MPSLRSALAGVLVVPSLFAIACSSSSPSSDGGGFPDSGVSDAGGFDAGGDAGSLATSDGGDAGLDAGVDAGLDAGVDAGTDGGPAAIEGLTASTWTWIDFPDAKCRDGSSTGIAINTNPGSTKLVIYLEGGGACFNSFSCVENPSTFGQADFQQMLDAGDLSQGLGDRAMAANPVADWNYVWVPYCTGDVHVGNNPASNVPGVGTQVFDGYQNIALYLSRIVPTFPGLTEVLLTGDSAGGFGAAGNYDQVSRAFPGVPVELLDDSGPPMESPVLASCLQDQWRQVWGLDSTLIAACGADCPDGGDFLLQYYVHEVKANPDRTFGLVESTADSVISLFYGFGENDCTTEDAIPPNSIPPEEFDGGLMDLRTQLAAYPNAGTFYFASTDHTSIGTNALYTRTAENTPLVGWVAALVDGGTSNVGP